MQTNRNYRKPLKRFLQKTAYDVYIWRKVPTPSVAMTADAEVGFLEPTLNVLCTLLFHSSTLQTRFDLCIHRYETAQIAHICMDVGIRNETAQFHFWEYLFQIFGTMSLQCMAIFLAGALQVCYSKVRVTNRVVPKI
jgi:hypothetical protein